MAIIITTDDQPVVIVRTNIQVVKVKDYGHAEYSEYQYKITGTYGQTEWTITDIEQAVKLVIQQANYMLFEKKTEGALGQDEFRRSGSTLTLGKPFAGERILLTTITPLTV